MPGEFEDLNEKYGTGPFQIGGQRLREVIFIDHIERGALRGILTRNWTWKLCEIELKICNDSEGGW